MPKQKQATTPPSKGHSPFTNMTPEEWDLLAFNQQKPPLEIRHFQVNF